MTPRPSHILDAGCGDARVLALLIEEGFQCKGFDNSPAMLSKAKEVLADRNISPDVVRTGDIYRIPWAENSCDLILCLGVLPVLPDHKAIFGEFVRVLAPGGRIVVSLENQLFDLFSMNQHSVGFCHRLFSDIGVPEVIAEKARSRLIEWFDLASIVDVPKAMADSEIDKSRVNIPKYNPLNVGGRLREEGFQLEAIRFYHYHPLPPRFESEFPELFRDLAESLETTAYDWRGGILCNVMVVQAILVD